MMVRQGAEEVKSPILLQKKAQEASFIQIGEYRLFPVRRILEQPILLSKKK
jgi:hypothetical protein